MFNCKRGIEIRAKVWGEPSDRGTDINLMQSHNKALEFCTLPSRGKIYPYYLGLSLWEKLQERGNRKDQAVNMVHDIVYGSEAYLLYCSKACKCLIKQHIKFFLARCQSPETVSESGVSSIKMARNTPNHETGKEFVCHEKCG